MRIVITESQFGMLINENRVAKILYHSTNIKNLKDIQDFGLLPMIGDTVKGTEGYMGYDEDDYEEKEERGLIFFTDKPQCGYSNFGKPLNLDECVLVLIRNNESIYRKVGFDILNYQGNKVNHVSTRDRDYYYVDNLPIYIEDGDYFTFDEQEPFAIYYGEELKRKFFNKV